MTPPVLPPVTPEASAGRPLGGVLGTLQEVVDLPARWAEVVEAATAQMLARVVGEAPGYLPWGAEFPDLLGEIRRVPANVRGALDALAVKLRRIPLRGGDARRAAYAAVTPELRQEALHIADASVVAAAQAVEQDVVSRAAASTASVVARDATLPAIVTDAHEAGAALLEGAQRMPSTRAGVELLVAGMGATMQHQADFAAALAGRLTALTQQTAAVSQQVAGLAAVTGVLAAQEVERDRRALDARLGLADVLAAGGHLLRDTLARVGERAGPEISIDPLY